MPSGSHGGGHGGSHGGGFGGGGGHFGHGRSTGGITFRPRPIRIWFFGHHYYVPVEKTSTIRKLFIAFVLFLIFGFLAMFSMFNAQKQMNLIEDDHDYYCNLVRYAILHPDFQKTGKITGRFENRTCRKWYLTYSLQTDNGQTLEGYTYSLYSNDEIFEFEIGSEIQLAVDTKVVTLSTDSINMDYLDIPIENDGEYVLANGLKKISMIFMIIMFCLSATCLGFGIFKMKKGMKLNELEKEKASSTFVEENVKRCPYCGSKRNPEDSKCQNCGASFID